MAFGRELGLNGEAFGSCLESGKYRQRVQDDRQEGQRMSVRSTPTFFIGNTKIEGNLPYERFRAVIEETLAR